MKLSSVTELSTILEEVYAFWSGYSTKLTILDLQILNYICRSYGTNEPCGLKELSADLNISMPTISRSLNRWTGKGGLINKVQSTEDKRRHYYIPNSYWLNGRVTVFSKINNQINSTK